MAIKIKDLFDLQKEYERLNEIIKELKVIREQTDLFYKLAKNLYYDSESGDFISDIQNKIEEKIKKIKERRDNLEI